MNNSLVMPVDASETINPYPMILQEVLYNCSQHIKASNQKPIEEKTLVQLSSSLHHKPSVFYECPYNRAACNNRIPINVPHRTSIIDKTTSKNPTTESEILKKNSAIITSRRNLVAIAQSNASFSTFAQALKTTGLVEILQGEGPFTIFAPTNEAFAKLPQDALRELLKPRNKKILVEILAYHIVSGSIESNNFKTGEIQTIQGDTIKIKIIKNVSTINNTAEVYTPNIKGSNGVIHIINKVIIPPSL
ncbi:fasciclin domain-containing protein [Richelia intracellularis]|uniref:fasciclin domain-containing protein n=1 Tax=Richelia intracellularis TaxID=1164990 RepID=UPI0018C8C341|nr:fasciclin domain-containing protein [Richelia intracellularis]